MLFTSLMIPIPKTLLYIYIYLYIDTYIDITYIIYILQYTDRKSVV